MDDATRDRIQALLDQHALVLFMKGTKHFPQCGFSATAVEVLRRCAVDFHTVNVLEDAEIRQGIKEYGNWPTVPQLYVKGKLVGGSDILVEMFENGELATMVKEATAS